MSRHRRSTTQAVRLDLLDALLGVSRTPASIDRLHARGIDYDPFLEFTVDQMPIAEFRALFEAHRPALTAEARRRGIPLPDPASYRPVPAGCWITGVIDD